MNEIKENVIKPLSEMNTMQDEFNKDTEILKKRQIETLVLKILISQIKTQLKASPID
jgi:hypothetical protein